MDNTTGQPGIPPAAGISKGLIIAIVVILAVLIGGGMIVRGMMGYAGKKVADTIVEKGIENASGGQVKVDANGGEVTVKGQDGSTVQWGSNKLPDGWPSDVTIYSGSTIQYSGSSNPASGKSGAAVIFQTSDPADKVVDFYKTDLAAKGWKIEGTYQSGTTDMIGASKNDRYLSIGISANDSMTAVTIGVETK